MAVQQQLEERNENTGGKELCRHPAQWRRTDRDFLAAHGAGHGEAAVTLQPTEVRGEVEDLPLEQWGASGRL